MMEDVVAPARRIEKILEEQTDTKMERLVSTMQDQIRLLKKDLKEANEQIAAHRTAAPPVAAMAVVPAPTAKLIGPRMGCQFFRNVDFSVTYPLKSVSCSMYYLRGTVSVLEIVFVRQCEVFVCLDFALAFFPLAAKLIGPRMGSQFFRNVDFSVTYPP